MQCDKAGVDGVVLGAGLENAECSWSETFTCGSSLEECKQEWRDASPGGFTSEGEYRRQWLFACIFHDAVTLLEEAHPELRDGPYESGLALDSECVIRVLEFDY